MRKKKFQTRQIKLRKMLLDAILLTICYATKNLNLREHSKVLYECTNLTNHSESF